METKAPLNDQGSQVGKGAPVPPPVDRVRIVSTPGTRGEWPRIDGHRITVQDVAVRHERMGMSPDEIVSASPTITLTDVDAALAYYFENREVIDSDIRADDQFASEVEAKGPGSSLEGRLRQRKADVANHPRAEGGCDVISRLEGTPHAGAISRLRAELLRQARV